MFKSIVPMESTDLNLKRAKYLIVSKRMILSFNTGIKRIEEPRVKEMSCLSLPKFRKNSRSFKF